MKCERCNGDRYIGGQIPDLPDEPCPVCNSGAPSGAERVRAAASKPPIVDKTSLAYPGAPVLLSCMTRRDETGDVRVQQFDEHNFRVGTFLPGIVVNLPGDGIKIEPEISQWVKSLDEAKEVFDRYVSQALGAGWARAEYSPD